ncbi:fimbrial protein [Klebsiella aerogenes]|uniref:Type 1 fimbrial protein n=1 Tax=Klebsiella aerogenes TaxID=548 RepID=A0AAP9R1B3_KLEAE|nr:fimbrial protein [Klebsiella aerogenes]QMR42821.1 type 1 fimbrial protein [Klebsiella aerogenes]
MNKKFLMVGIIPLVIASGARAVDNGTVSFSGELKGGTCNVSIDGQGPDGTVILPVQTADDANASAITGTTPFTIDMTGCSGNYTGARVNFEAGAGVSGSYVTNTGTATGVDLILSLDSSGAPAIIPGSDATQADYSDITSGSASQKFYVSYYTAAGAATAGTVTGSVTYRLDYQ